MYIPIDRTIRRGINKECRDIPKGFRAKFRREYLKRLKDNVKKQIIAESNG